VEQCKASLPKILQIEDIWDTDRFITVPNQVWNRQLCLPGLEGVSLSTPKPDQTVGLQQNRFPYLRTLARLPPYATPLADTPLLHFPTFTVEAKGDKGNSKVSRLQNLHNAAIMGHCLLMVHEKLGSEPKFFNKVFTTTLSLTTESMELSYYWAVRANGQVGYYGRIYDSWPLNNKNVALFREGYRNIRNALEWCGKMTEERLMLGLEPLNKTSTPMSTPQSTSSLSRKRKKRRDNESSSQPQGSASQSFCSEHESQIV
jgi:hypothetical protein